MDQSNLEKSTKTPTMFSWYRLKQASPKKSSMFQEEPNTEIMLLPNGIMFRCGKSIEFVHYSYDIRKTGVDIKWIDNGFTTTVFLDILS